MMITVRDLLYGNADAEFEVLAGHRGLDKEVKAISFIDAPSSMEWLRGNEVILTTAFLYQADENSLQYFVRGLINKNVTALGIKMGRYIKKIPPSILEMADANMFPIFVLPYEMVWSEFIEKFYQRNNNYEDIGRYLKLSLSSLMMQMDINGDNRSKLQQIFTETLNIPAVIVDNDYNILTKNNEPGVSEIELFCGTQQKRPQLHPFRMQTTIVDNIWFLDAVISDAEHLIIASRDGSISNKDVDRLCILYNSSRKKRLLQSNRDFLLRSLVAGIVFSSPQSDLQEIAQQLNIGYNNKFWIVIVAGDKADQGCTMCKKVFEKVLGPKECIFFQIDVGIQENRYMVAFVSLRALQISKTELGYMVRRAFGEEHLEGEQYKLFFSEACNRFDDLRKCYVQAHKTYQYYHVLGVQNTILHDYGDVQPFEYLLRTDISLDEIDMLSQKITTFDAVQALELYLEYNNIRLAAEANFVHENTMRYRINKARAEVEYDFSNPITRLTFLLKIKLWRIHETQKKLQRN